MGMFLVCLFGGFLGLHKFIERKVGLGILYLLTGGLFGIGWLIDTIVYACKLFEKKPKPVIEPQPVNETPVVKDPQPITPKPSAPTKVTPTKNDYERHKVTGTSHYLDNVMSLASINDTYNYTKKEMIDEEIIDENIYQYDFYPNKVELVPEPDNPYDKNAIKVVIDGAHVGYIKAGSCGRVRNLLNSNTIEKIEPRIVGGKYKSLEYDEDEDSYTLVKDEKPIFIDLKFYIKKEAEE